MPKNKVIKTIRPLYLLSNQHQIWALYRIIRSQIFRETTWINRNPYKWQISFEILSYKTHKIKSKKSWAKLSSQLLINSLISNPVRRSKCQAVWQTILFVKINQKMTTWTTMTWIQNCNIPIILPILPWKKQSIPMRVIRKNRNCQKLCRKTLICKTKRFLNSAASTVLLSLKMIKWCTACKIQGKCTRYLSTS